MRLPSPQVVLLHSEAAAAAGSNRAVPVVKKEKEEEEGSAPTCYSRYCWLLLPEWRQKSRQEGGRRDGAKRKTRRQHSEIAPSLLYTSVCLSLCPPVCLSAWYQSRRTDERTTTDGVGGFWLERFPSAFSTTDGRTSRVEEVFFRGIRSGSHRPLKLRTKHGGDNYRSL
jgi:hypothetical protein